MLSRLRHSCFFFLFTCFLPLTTYAWNSVGHMVVANIAYQNVQSSVRDKIDKLVSFFNKEYPEMNSFQKIAIWPDVIRSQRIDNFTRWHYIDVPFSGDGTPLKNTIDTDNGLWAVYALQPPIKNTHVNSYERVRFLAFLTHIVGDLHQPLHTVTRISANNPNGDKGGNLFYVRYNNARTDLHAVWDQGVGALTGPNSPQHIDELTYTITALYPPSYFGNQIDDLDPHHWAAEGMNSAQQFIYNTPENAPLPPIYISGGQKLSQRAVALAGYRLAKILNQLLGSDGN